MEHVRTQSGDNTELLLGRRCRIWVFASKICRRLWARDLLTCRRGHVAVLSVLLSGSALCSCCKRTRGRRGRQPKTLVGKGREQGPHALPLLGGDRKKRKCGRDSSRGGDVSYQAAARACLQELGGGRRCLCAEAHWSPRAASDFPWVPEAAGSWGRPATGIPAPPGPASSVRESCASPPVKSRARPPGGPCWDGKRWSLKAKRKRVSPGPPWVCPEGYGELCPSARDSL